MRSTARRSRASWPEMSRQVGADGEVVVGSLQLGDDRVARSLVEVDHGHTRAGARENESHLAPDSAGRAGDEAALPSSPRSIIPRRACP